MKTQNDLTRNNSITIWRIVFSLCILGEHSGLTGRWIVPVEFFFLTSGYLLAQEVYEKGAKESGIQYAWKRVKRLYPMYFISMLLYGIAFMGLYAPETVSSSTVGKFIIHNLLASYRQFLMLQVWGQQQMILLNPICWYVATIFWDGIILYIFLKWIPPKQARWLIGISSFLILSVYCIKVGHLDVWEIHRSVILDGRVLYMSDALMRGFADMGLGVLIYCVKEKYGNKITEIFKEHFIWLEMAGYLFVIIAAFYMGKSRWDYLFLGVLCVCVLLSFLPHKSPWINNKVIRYLGRWTYGVYLNQSIFIIVLLPLVVYSINTPWKKFIVSTIASVLLTMICEIAIKGVGKIVMRICRDERKSCKTD